jgi:2-keto-4-pentenoate hydratase/2-oxohepta-3-ene-1,7-dioic acid hydratase in catechol pathway
MKVIGFTGNYGKHEEMPHSYLMADSSILYTGRPFFVPDYAQRFLATPTIVVRTGRLGKCIAPKFAHRYWDAFTAGFSVQALQGDDERLVALDRAFDGAAIVGDWVETSAIEDPLHAVVEVTVNEETVARCCLAEMCTPLAELLSAVSTRCSIKMGDLLFTGDAGEGHTMAPGDRLRATVNGRQVLDVNVKL